MNRKEELQRELKEIEEQERKDLIEKEFPNFQNLIGKFFKYENSYSSPEEPSDYWWVYRKVISITPDDLYIGRENIASSYCRVVSFQKDKYGNIEFKPEDETHTHYLGEEISENEYNEAFELILKELSNLKNK